VLRWCDLVVVDDTPNLKDYPPESEIMSQHFVKRGEKIHGPFSQSQLQEGQESKKLLADDLISEHREGPWQALDVVLGGTTASIHLNNNLDNTISDESQAASVKSSSKILGDIAQSKQKPKYAKPNCSRCNSTEISYTKIIGPVSQRAELLGRHERTQEIDEQLAELITQSDEKKDNRRFNLQSEEKALEDLDLVIQKEAEELTQNKMGTSGNNPAYTAFMNRDKIFQDFCKQLQAQYKYEDKKNALRTLRNSVQKSLSKKGTSLAEYREKITALTGEKARLKKSGGSLEQHEIAVIYCLACGQIQSAAENPEARILPNDFKEQVDRLVAVSEDAKKEMQVFQEVVLNAIESLLETSNKWGQQQDKMMLAQTQDLCRAIAGAKTHIGSGQVAQIIQDMNG
jgi:hypothetical protein